METLKTITDFFATIWNVFTIKHPVIGIPFSIIYIGIFAVGFSIMILKPLLGLGFGVVTDISTSAKGFKSGLEARRRAKYERSYEKYKRDRNRGLAYEKRYEKERNK